jgi:hypothetical protein
MLWMYTGKENTDNMTACANPLLSPTPLPVRLSGPIIRPGRRLGNAVRGLSSSAHSSVAEDLLLEFRQEPRNSALDLAHHPRLAPPAPATSRDHVAL